MVLWHLTTAALYSVYQIDRHGLSNNDTLHVADYLYYHTVDTSFNYRRENFRRYPQEII
jgi:hypothetical protein